MLSIQAIYDGKKIIPLEKIDAKPNVRVIVTFLEEDFPIFHFGENNVEPGHGESEADDPWDALDMESVATDTGRTDGSVRHDHYIYGTPKR